MHDTLTSFTTSNFSTPFPALSTAEYATLDRVVASLPPGASSWTVFNDTYRRLAVDDKEFYALFLKLSLEQGKDWKDKWESAKRSLRERGLDPAVDLAATAPVAVDARKSKSSKGFDILKKKVEGVQEAVAREFLVPGYSSSDDYVGVPSVSSSMLFSRSKASRTPAAPSSSARRRTSSIPKPPAVVPQPQSSSELQADDFRRFSLLSLAFYNWRVKFSRAATLSRTLDERRRALVLRSSLDVWRSRLVKVIDLDRRCNAIVRIREKRLMAGAMVRWKRTSKEKRKRDWENRLRDGFELVRLKLNDRLRRQVLFLWHLSMLRARASRFRRVALLLPTFQHWHSRLQQTLVLAERSTAVIEAHHNTLKQGILGIWRKKANLARVERWYLQQTNRSFLKGCLSLWQERLHESRRRQRLYDVAVQHSLVRTTRSALGIWRRRLVNVQTLDVRCDSLVERFSHRMLHATYRRMILICSSSLLRTAMTRRWAVTLLHRWRDRTQHITVELEGRAMALKRRADNAISAECLDAWLEAVDRHRLAFSYAGQMYDRNLNSRTIKSWRKTEENQRIEEAKADVARAFFVQRRTWNLWCDKIHAKKVQRWKAKVKLGRKRLVFNAWLSATREAKAAQVLVNQFNVAVDSRILSEMLKKWTKRVVDVRAREMEVQAQYNMRLSRRAFEKWKERCLKHGEDYSLVESFQLVKVEELLSKCFRQWLKASRRSRELKERLQSALEHSDRNCLENAFSVWRQHSLKSVAREVESMRQARIMAVAFHLWKSKTQSLPALHFDRERTLRRALDTWKSQVPDRSLVRQAMSMDRLTTTSSCLDIWKARFHARNAMRSVNRFRSFAASASRSPRPAVVSTTRPSASSFSPRRPILSSTPATPSYIPSTPLPLRQTTVTPSTTVPRLSTQPTPNPMSVATPAPASPSLRTRLSSEHSRSRTGSSIDGSSDVGSRSAREDKLGVVGGGGGGGLRARLRAAALSSRK